MRYLFHYSCVCGMQVLMSPLRCHGIGLSDGEVLERLWSYLRRFGRMTKEMRPAHRVDILTHALLHYGDKTKQKLRMCTFNTLDFACRHTEVKVFLQPVCCTAGGKGQRTFLH